MLSPAQIESRASRRLAALRTERVVERAWARDFTLWGDVPTEIADRLGWLDLPQTMLPQLPRLQSFAKATRAEGFTRALLLGMGGSSLAPEVIASVRGIAPGFLQLQVLDTTEPATIADAGRDLPSTLVIVASKSGGTIETRSQFDYLWSLAPGPRQYVVITDPGSALEAVAHERGVREVFLNPPDLGGRFSALSLFGLVPGALLGADLDRLLDGARRMAERCQDADPAGNPGIQLGARLAEASLAGQDKLQIVLPHNLAPLGSWIEQLVAESTGKNGRGIVPVDAPVPRNLRTCSRDRIFVGAAGDPAIVSAAEAGHPAVELDIEDGNPGGEFFRWEFATAIAGHILGVQPFDQPDVQAAKDATARALAEGADYPKTPSARAVLASLREGDYIALLAFLPMNDASRARLDAVRDRLANRYGVPVTVGFGPRYLHSTGQLHKGGADNGVFLVVTDPGTPAEDPQIPGKPYTFGQLFRAQAAGDLGALIARGRRVARLDAPALESI